MNSLSSIFFPIMFGLALYDWFIEYGVNDNIAGIAAFGLAMGCLVLLPKTFTKIVKLNGKMKKDVDSLKSDIKILELERKLKEKEISL